MRFSRFGEKFSGKAGIGSLMDDLGRALSGQSSMRMMGGGNPGLIPEVQEALREGLLQIAAQPEALHRLTGIYDPPQGEPGFVAAMADLLRRELGWPVSAEHIALTNGSQSAFFMLFNLFGGRFADGVRRDIVLPLIPEYIGYADAGIEPDLFRAARPEIDPVSPGRFKYRVDFDALALDDSVAAMCVSRPTNPSGNVLTDAEMLTLSELARQRDIPLIVDSAYGLPFPDLVYTEARPIWNEQLICCLSLSKFGLPAARTGIVVARPDIIRALSGMNAIINLAPGSFGAMLAEPLVRSGEILRLSREVIKPFYQARAASAMRQLDALLAGTPYRLHVPEGAMFLWLWLPGLPISSAVLYERLKQRGVLVVSGHYFFPGLSPRALDDWPHTRECLRITYSQDESTVSQGLAILAEEVKAAYAGS